MTSAPDRPELLTALTTEHFTLQGARAQAAAESASRTSLYVLSISSTLVALGFVGQSSRPDQTFTVFALTVLPTVYVLGIFTFIRVVECSAEDYRYGMAINRIRHYYQTIAGDQAHLFLLSGHDDGPGVFANAALPAEGRRHYFSFATVVAMINSVVGGGAFAIAVNALDDGMPLAVSAVAGCAVGLISLVVLIRLAERLLQHRTASLEPVFPSPTGSADDVTAPAEPRRESDRSQGDPT